LISFQMRKKWIAIGAAVALWIPAVYYGARILLTYSTTPGRPAEPLREWPTGSAVVRGSLERNSQHYTLLLFAHPQCSCTKATLGELALLMAHSGGQLDAKVFFYLPAVEASSWARTDLWQTASAIPGVRAFEDRDGGMAQRFGAFTSGQTLLYSPSGRLLFHGGITAFRGHSGDNAGRSAITALLRGEIPPASPFPLVTKVFGCSLRGS
jgi:hypothetical protein